MRPQLIGLPYDASSSFLRGSAAAPQVIRQALRSPAGNSWTELGVDLDGQRRLVDSGDLPLSDSASEARTRVEAGIATMLEHGFRPIALGGDHSLTYPIARAMARRYHELAILHIDAHGDLYDVYEGDRYSHACPFARIMEEGLASRLVQVGIRTMTGHQRAQAERFGVDVIDMRRWATGARPFAHDAPVTKGTVPFSREATKRGLSPFYLSIDLDGIDPAFAPGVSHREPGGLSVRDVISLIHSVPGTIVGADVVEFNPSQDLGGVTAHVAAKIVKEIAGAMLADT
ncbi:MAG: agmatinase [Vicinamibacterales bacterium]